MKQMLLIVSLLAGLNAFQATAEDWSGRDVVDQFIKENFETNCFFIAVPQLVKNILHGMPSDVSYILFSDMFSTNDSPFETRYIYASIYERTLDYMNGYFQIDTDIRSTAEKHFGLSMGHLTDNEFMQFAATVDACNLAGFDATKREWNFDLKVWRWNRFYLLLHF